MGSVTFCNVFGKKTSVVMEVEPQPDNTAFPLGKEFGSGSLIGWTNALKERAFDSFIKAMSNGATPLKNLL